MENISYKRFRRIFYGLITFLIIFSAVPFGAVAAGEYTDTLYADPIYIVDQDFEEVETGTNTAASIPGYNMILYTYPKDGVDVDSGMICVADDGSGNRALKYHKWNQDGAAHYTDLRISYGGVNVNNYDQFVLQFDFRYDGNAYSYTMVQGRKEPKTSGNMKMQNFLQMTATGNLTSAKNTVVAPLSSGIWYNIILVVNDAEKIYDVYVNGEKKITEDFSEPSIANGEGWHYTSLRSLILNGANVGGAGSECINYVDNVKVYVSEEYRTSTETTPTTPDPANPTTPDPDPDPAPGINDNLGNNGISSSRERTFTAEPVKSAVDKIQKSVSESKKDKIVIMSLSAGSVGAAIIVALIKKKIG